MHMHVYCIMNKALKKNDDNKYAEVLFVSKEFFYSQFIFPQNVFSVTVHTSIRNGVYIISVYMYR